MQPKGLQGEEDDHREALMSCALEREKYIYFYKANVYISREGKQRKKC